MSNETLIDQINSALIAHGHWKIKLRTAVAKGKSEHSVNEVRCDEKCEFGKWLYSTEIDSEMRASIPYTVVKRLHAEFHVCASDVLYKALTNDAVGAATILEDEFMNKSEKLSLALRKWKGEAAAS